MRAKGVLVPAGALVATALMAVACGGSHPAADANGTTTTAPVTATTVPVGPTTTTRPATTTSRPASAGAQPAGGPVPPGFDPVSFTAVSVSEYWLLGQAPCSNPVCTSIVRTVDDGAHFVGLPAPTSPLDVGDNGANGAINTLRFANALDGYAFDTNPGGAFWDTHDGGEHWSHPSALSARTLLAFGTGAGYAFALVGSCPAGGCTDVVLLRSPVSSDQWTDLSVPIPSGVSPVATMTVHGSNLWFSLTTGANTPNQLLVVGTGAGASFTTHPSPCSATLAGTIEATSATVLWAACPTGTMGEVFRSTDGGAHWQQLSTGQVENSALLAPASDTTAVLQPASQGELLRTSDGGSSWQTVSSGVSNGYWAWIGFTDASTGSALQVESNVPANWPWPNGPAPEQLWRSTNGGTTWSGPVSFA